MLAGITTSAPAVRLIFPVPAVSIVMSAFDPLDIISLVVICVVVIVPFKVGEFNTGVVNVLLVNVNVADA